MRARGGTASRRAVRDHPAGVRQHRGTVGRPAGRGPRIARSARAGSAHADVRAPGGTRADPGPPRHAARHHARRPRHLRQPRAGHGPRGRGGTDRRRARWSVRRPILPALEADGTFAYVARQVDLDVSQRVADLSLPGHRVPPGAEALLPGGRAGAGRDRLRGRRRTGPGGAGEGVRRGARRRAGGADVRAERRPADRAGHRRREGAGRRRQPAHDARPRDAVPGAGGAAGGRGGERRQVRHGHRDGRADRGHLRHGELPMVRSEQLRARGDARSGTAAEPSRSPTRSSPDR